MLSNEASWQSVYPYLPIIYPQTTVAKKNQDGDVFVM